MEILIKGTLLKTLVDAITDVKIETTTFNFTPHGLSIQSLSPDALAFVSVFLSPETFELYKCEEATPIEFNLVQFSRVLQIVTDEYYVVRMSADQGKNNLQVMFENRRAEFPVLCFGFRFQGLDLGWLVKSLRRLLGRRRSEGEEMKKPLLDEEVEEGIVGVEEKDYSAVVKMRSATLVRVCSELSRDYGLDEVGICVTKKGVEFFNDKRSIMEKVKKLPRLSVKLTGEPVERTFDLDSLRRFTTATPLSKMVTVCISPQIPAMVEYKIDHDMGYIRFYFPPIVQEDE